MRTETITRELFEFDELSDDAKQTAIDNHRYWNVEVEWWDFTYDDASGVGLTITGFDIGRGNECTGELTIDMMESIDIITREHGEECETYKTAQEFRKEWSELVSKYSDGVNTDQVADDNEYEFDQDADALEQEYTKMLLEDYLVILRNEYEYLTSDEAIAESLLCNEMEFTEDGEDA